jgi:subtilisin family serine protease
MAQLKVVVPLLNKRRFPVENTADKSNVIGQVKKDFQFESIGEVTNALGNWYQDRDGYYYWGGGVSKNIAESSLLDINIPWWMQQLRIPEIWSTYNEKGANAKVAVIDSGYNINNPEIKNAVISEYIHPAFPNTVSINDTYGHGTYCASIIGARNSNYLVGCAPECELYIAKLTEDDTYELTMLYDAIDWAIKQCVDIISISQGGPFDENTCKLITKAFSNNIIVVASIGNNPITTQKKLGGKYPALCEDCIAVGATTKSNQISLVTLINTKTEINAPGEDICGYINQNIPNKFPEGTSQATAIVSGICALVISKYKSLNKPYTAATIKNLITSQYDIVLGSPSQKLISPIKIFANL